MPNRLPIRDPRTVSRDIPGLLDIVFPRLSGGLVAALNRRIVQFNSAAPLSGDLLTRSVQQRSLLFEIAVAHAEAIISEERGAEPSFEESAEVAVRRQQRHFDARAPEELSSVDIEIIQLISSNLVSMLRDFARQTSAQVITVRPSIPGFGWIGSGVGDFAADDSLIEVKNTDRNFVASDYRQILMYWMLAYSRGLEDGSPVWSHYLLLNPRLNRAVYGTFDQLVEAASGGLGRVEVYEYMRAIVVGQTEPRK